MQIVNGQYKEQILSPSIDDFVDQQQGACFFCKIKHRSGYHQLRVNKDDIPKTSFKTRYGPYEFRVMCILLTNYRNPFMDLINMVFRQTLICL